MRFRQRSQRYHAPERGDPRLRQGLLGQWLVGGGSGRTLPDSSGCGRHAVFGLDGIGDPTSPEWSHAGDHEALHLDGLHQHGVVAGSISLACPITLSGWFKCDPGAEAIENTGQYNVVVAVADSISFNRFWIGPQSTAGFTSGATAGQLDGNSGTATAAWVSTPNIFGDYENWHHVAGVFRTDSDRSVYLDGNRADDTVAKSPTANVTSILVGSVLNYSLVNTNTMEGYLRDVRLYNRALSDAEIYLLQQRSFSPMVHVRRRAYSFASVRRWILGTH